MARHGKAWHGGAVGTVLGGCSRGAGIHISWDIIVSRCFLGTFAGALSWPRFAWPSVLPASPTSTLYQTQRLGLDSRIILSIPGIMHVCNSLC